MLYMNHAKVINFSKKPSKCIWKDFHILSSQHREYIYRERFSKDVSLLLTINKSISMQQESTIRMTLCLAASKLKREELEIGISSVQDLMVLKKFTDFIRSTGASSTQDVMDICKANSSHVNKLNRIIDRNDFLMEFFPLLSLRDMRELLSIFKDAKKMQLLEARMQNK